MVQLCNNSSVFFSIFFAGFCVVCFKRFLDPFSIICSNAFSHVVLSWLSSLSNLRVLLHLFVGFIKGLYISPGYTFFSKRGFVIMFLFIKLYRMLLHSFMMLKSKCYTLSIYCIVLYVCNSVKIWYI